MNDDSTGSITLTFLALLFALFAVLFSGIISSRNTQATPVPTLSPTQTNTPNTTPVRLYDAPATYTPLPKVTRILPTATATIDLAMTEIAKGADKGILVLPLGAETALPAGATPAPRFTLSPDAFPVCNPNYASVCLPANQGQAHCYDLVERNILVIGTDNLGIDGDNDGIACEENE